MKSLSTLKTFFEKQLRLLMINLRELEIQKCNILNAGRALEDEINLIQNGQKGSDSRTRIGLQILHQRIKAYKNQIDDLDLEIQLCRNKIVRCYIQLNKIIVLKNENIFSNPENSNNGNKQFCYNKVWQEDQSLVLI